MEISSFLCFDCFPSQLHKNCKVIQLHAVHQNSFIVVRSRTKRNVKKLINSILTHIYFTKEWRSEHFSALICLLFLQKLCDDFLHTFIRNYSKSFKFFFCFKTLFLLFFLFQNPQKFVSREKFFFHNLTIVKYCARKASETFHCACNLHMEIVLSTKLKLALCCAETFHSMSFPYLCF